MRDFVEPLFRQFITDNRVENFVAVYSTGNFKYLGGCLIKRGTKNTITLINYDNIFSAARDLKAKQIWLAHNHTSQDLTPSKNDIEFTTCFDDECDGEGFRFIDHYILHPTQGYSRILKGLQSADSAERW